GVGRDQRLERGRPGLVRDGQLHGDLLAPQPARRPPPPPLAHCGKSRNIGDGRSRPVGQPRLLRAPHWKETWACCVTPTCRGSSTSRPTSWTATTTRGPR